MVAIYNKRSATGVRRGLQPRCSFPHVKYGLKSGSTLHLRALNSASTTALPKREKRFGACFLNSPRVARLLKKAGITFVFYFAHNFLNFWKSGEIATEVLRKNFLIYIWQYENK